uniref:Uncharacterized protein n=1 Tax=Onchocerca volvulus TaxID=6282 RepID=A0A8R1XVB1_ONCVO
MSETSPVYKGKIFAVLTHASFQKPINICGNEIQTDFVTFTLDLPVSNIAVLFVDAYGSSRCFGAARRRRMNGIFSRPKHL